MLRTSDPATVLSAIRSAVAPALQPASDPWLTTSATQLLPVVTTAWNAPTAPYAQIRTNH